MVSFSTSFASEQVIQLSTDLTEPTISAQPVLAVRRGFGPVSLLQTEVVERLTAHRAVCQLEDSELGHRLM